MHSSLFFAGDQHGRHSQVRLSALPLAFAFPSAVLALPTPGREMPVRASLLPMVLPTLRHPVICGTRFDPMPFHPDIAAAIPCPKSRRPDEARTWRRKHYNTRGRWSHFDTDIEFDLGESRHHQSAEDNERAPPHTLHGHP